MQKAVFIINPLSQSVAKNGSLLEKAAQDLAVETLILDDFTKLDKLIKKIAKSKPKLVFIEAGDGTIQGVLSQILAQKSRFTPLPAFVLLPGGMTNLIAKHLGLKKPNLKKIAALLQAKPVAPHKKLPLVQINYAGEGTIYRGFLLSTGALPQATRHCLDKVDKSDISGAQAIRGTLLRVILGHSETRKIVLKPSKLALSIGDDVCVGMHILTVATTLPKMMLGINPFWGKGDGDLHISHVNADAKHITRNILSLFKKTQSPTSVQRLKQDGFRSWNTGQATLTHDGPVVLDGEFLPLSKKPITLSTTQPLLFLQ